MRRTLLAAVTAGVCLGLSVATAAAEEPQELVAKAIKAYGGEDKLAKKAGTSKVKGRLELAGGLDITQDISFQLPNKFKEVLEMTVNGQKVTVTTVYNGKEGWINANGQNIPVEDKILTELKEAANVMRVGRLLDLKDKAYELTLIGDAKVEGKDAVGVKVATKGYRDINLYFDKKTGLPLKTERRAYDFQANQEVTEERIVAEYGDQDGVKIPKKVVVMRDGKKFMEAEVLEYKPLDQLDDSTFDKP